MEDHIIRGNGPTAMSSKLGYLLSGPLPIEQTVNTTTSLHVSTNCYNNESDLTQFWQIESAGTSAVSNHKEDSFLVQYSLTCISRQPDGSYCARLPWKITHPPLLSNREICLKRTRSLVRRLSQSPQLLQTYDNIIHDQVKKGFIEKVQDSSDQPNKTHYIPHHCV